MKIKFTAALAAIVIVTSLTHPAEARRHHYNSTGHFICGLTQRLYFGIRDPALNLAREWARRFPHVAARPGAVVVQWRTGRALGGGPGGHVSRIVNVVDACHAVVTDEKGTYERDICRRLIAYVVPN